jgi:hypothetical protein
MSALTPEEDTSVTLICAGERFSRTDLDQARSSLRSANCPCVSVNEDTQDGDRWHSRITPEPDSMPEQDNRCLGKAPLSSWTKGHCTALATMTR